jgi:hypothetical protein
MKHKYLQFFIRLTLMTAILGFLCWALTQFLPENSISPVYPYILILFYIITGLIHYILLRITALNPRRFVSYFMLATFVKLIVYFTVVLIYVFNFSDNLLPFIITFFVLYIFYTAFEVVLILKQTKEI